MTFEVFFDSYVHNFMLRDVGREIAAAHRDEDAANFLCALGLLCYTEALGRWVPGVKRGSRNAFEAFFGRLGPSYEKFITAGEDPYDFYRNGMVHAYLAKGRAQIAMLENPARPVACGVLVDNGYYTFVVERYFQDFVVASARLHIELVGHRHPLVHMHAPHLFPYALGRGGVNEDLG
jgi:hypothetical protein